MTFARILKRAAALAALVLLPAAAIAAPVIVNPSFEANPKPAAWPHYLPGMPNSTYVTGWTTAGGGMGLNDAAGPFADNGIIPDGTNVFFLQNATGTLSQEVAGFEAGKTYTIVVFANARGGATLPRIQVSIAFGAVIPDTTITQSGAGNPYTVLSNTFTSPGDGPFMLEIVNLEGSADNTLLVDNILIVEQGAPPEISVSRTAMDFGSVQRGSSKDMTFVITNTGDAALSVSSLALSGAGAGVYSVVSPAGAFSVPGLGGTQVVTVRFAPTAAETFSATLTVNSNDADEAAIPITLTGLAPTKPFIVNNSFEADPVPGFPGALNPIFGWVHVPDGGNRGINDKAGPFFDNGLLPDGEKVAYIQGAFGLQQEVAGFVAGKQYRLMYFENRRNGPHSSRVAVSVAFSEVVPEHEIATPVGPGNPFRLVSGDFASPGDGSFILLLENRAPATGPSDDNTALFDLITIVEVGGAPDAHVTPTALDFAVTEAGAPVQRTFHLFNVGGSPLNVTGITVTGDDAADFTLVSPAGAFAVASAQGQAVVVSFDPSAMGDRTATLEIASNDPTEPTISIPLEGEGVAGVVVSNPSFEVDPVPGAPGYASIITGWTVNGGGGFHNHNDYATFHDNGLTPDGNNVAFIQGAGSFRQQIPGFKTDKEYTIRIDVNRRYASTADAPFQMSLGGEFLFGSETPIPIAPVQVGGEFTVPFRRFEIPKWTPPSAGTHELVISHVQPEGDTTLVFDNIYIAEHVNAASHWSIFQ